jgi:hypothetical protein
MVFFAIPWTAFSIFWICRAAGFKWPTWDGPQSLFPLFGLPFLLIGIGMFSAPFWARSSAKNSAYVITNKRAICLNWKFFSADIESFNAEMLQKITKSMSRSGRGDLVFEKKAQGSGRYKRIGFIGIDDVQNVERIILENILTQND